MKFETLYILNLFWGLIGVFALMAWGISRRDKTLFAFAEARILTSIAPGFSTKRRWIKTILVVLAFAFAIVALAGPQVGYRWEKITQKGVDIMIALDCSKSMLARDISPNRMERAKREIVDLLRMLRSDRAGLVAFSGTAFLQCPLTLDHEAFYIFLNALEPGYLPVGGTNLDAAIQASFDGFEKESDTRKAIIIITDGEGTQGEAGAAAKKMAELGIKIFAIGVGDMSGAPIPDESGGFKKDTSGNIILSKVNEKGLKELADLTGGTYVRSVAGDMDLDLIYMDKILGGMEKQAFESGRKKVWENRYQWFLFPAVLLLLIEMMLPLRKRKNASMFRTSAILFFLVLFVEVPAYAQMISSSVKEGIRAYDEQTYEKAKNHFIDAQLKDPDNPVLYYNIGAAAYKNQEYEHAVENFVQAAKTEDKSLRNKALYNLSNSYYRLGKLDEAIRGYESLLEEFPDDLQAKENLAFVKEKAKSQQKDQSESNEDSQKQKQEKNKDQEKANQKKSDQDQQKNGQEENKRKEDPDEKQNEQEKSKQQQKNQNPQQGADKDDKQDQSSDATPEDTKPEDQDNARQQRGQAGEPGENKDSQGKQQMEQMLNRLEDKPGQAIMPAAGGQHVEKDW